MNLSKRVIFLGHPVDDMVISKVTIEYRRFQHSELEECIDACAMHSKQVKICGSFEA